MVEDNGGSGGTIFDDNGSAFGVQVYHRDHANPVPLAVTAIENYGRVYRLSEGQRSRYAGSEYRIAIHRRQRARF